MTTITQSIAELKTLVGQAETELQLLQSGKKASAPRVRASLQKIKTLSHSMRGLVMTFTKELPTVSRVKKVTAESDELPLERPVLKREFTEAPVVKPKPTKKKAVKSVKTIEKKICTTV